jgi:hypothetical protein
VVVVKVAVAFSETSTVMVRKITLTATKLSYVTKGFAECEA